MSDNTEDALTFWLGRLVLEQRGSEAQEMVLDDIEDQVNSGSTMDDAIASVTGASTRAGDFGVEIAGSMLAVALAEGLKTFWTAYLNELAKKLAVKLADVTVDCTKRMFVGDLRSENRSAVLGKLRACLGASAALRELPPESLDAVITAAVSDSDAEAGGPTH